jgi:2-methylfumaryl-CoA isomerase
VLQTLGIAVPVAALEAELGVDFSQDEGVRFDHRDRLFPLFEQALAQRDMAELGPLFDKEGVCWGPYQTLSQAQHDPRLFVGNPVFSPVTQPSGRSYPAPGFAGTIPQDERRPSRPAPRLGADTDEVLADVLGLSSTEIARLHDQGLVAGPQGVSV